MTFIDDGIDLDPSDFASSVPLKKVPNGDVFEASRAGDVERLRYLLESGVNVNARDQWDSVALYYACLAGHLDAARMLLENGAICSEHTFDGDRCHYAALNLKVRKLLKAFEARPPPLAPLQASLRDTFLACPANSSNSTLSHFQIPGISSTQGSSSSHFPPDVVFIIQGRPIEAHRVILSARSPLFKKKFETIWKERSEVRLSREKLSYPALYSLIHFFYSDRLEIAVDDMEDLVRICKVCKCESLRKIIEKEVIHQKYAEYKALRDVDNSQKRYILQGLSLPEEDRLPAALRRILLTALSNSTHENGQDDGIDELVASMGSMQMAKSLDDLADVCVRVDRKIFRCHKVILASRSEYFKARLSRMKDFHEGNDELSVDFLPCLEEHDMSKEAFEKMIEYMYTDGLQDINPDQAEEMLDVASRYLLFPLKRAVADVLLPHLEMVSPEELCHWLILADMYGVFKIREYCLDTIACNFETFADTKEFRAMLLTLPPPSGDSSLRTTVPSIPGSSLNIDQGNLLDDLREKWLEIEAAELDKRDESALQFDKRLEMLMLVAEQEKSSGNADSDGNDVTPMAFSPITDLISGDDQEGIKALKQHLFEHFQTKDLGPLRYFLGIEVAQSKSGVAISQRKYALDILEETGLTDCKPVDTPMDPNVKLLPNQGEPYSDPGRYRRLVGKLNYLTMTRPDISFPVSVVSQFLNSPCESHWHAVVRILRYLKGSPGKGLVYSDRGHTNIVGYSDADWAGDASDRRSTTGYCVFLGGNLVSWKSKKQSVVARSSTEAEYRAMAHTTCELLWLKSLIQELQFCEVGPMGLMCDNQSALYLSSNPVFHERTKHIEVDCHFIREKILSGVIKTSSVCSKDQLADIFTKSLRGPRITYICDKLDAYDMYAPA